MLLIKATCSFVLVTRPAGRGTVVVIYLTNSIVFMNEQILLGLIPMYLHSQCINQIEPMSERHTLPFFFFTLLNRMDFLLSDHSLFPCQCVWP